jgi:hypothetical protein
MDAEAGQHRRRSLLVTVATGLLGAAAVVAGGGLLLGLGFVVEQEVDVYNAVSGMERTEVPGTGEVRLDPGDHVIYHEYDDGDPNAELDACRLDAVTLRGPETAPEVVLTDRPGERYPTVGDYEGDGVISEGVSCSRFEVEDPGVYTVSAAGEPGRIAIGPDLHPLRNHSTAARLAVGGLISGACLAMAALWCEDVACRRAARARRREPSDQLQP